MKREKQFEKKCKTGEALPDAMACKSLRRLCDVDRFSGKTCAQILGLREANLPGHSKAYHLAETDLRDCRSLRESFTETLRPPKKTREKQHKPLPMIEEAPLKLKNRFETLDSEQAEDQPDQLEKPSDKLGEDFEKESRNSEPKSQISQEVRLWVLDQLHLFIEYVRTISLGTFATLFDFPDTKQLQEDWNECHTSEEQEVKLSIFLDKIEELLSENLGPRQEEVTAVFYKLRKQLYKSLKRGESWFSLEAEDEDDFRSVHKALLEGYETSSLSLPFEGLSMRRILQPELALQDRFNRLIEEWDPTGCFRDRVDVGVVIIAFNRTLDKYCLCCCWHGAGQLKITQTILDNLLYKYVLDAFIAGLGSNLRLYLTNLFFSSVYIPETSDSRKPLQLALQKLPLAFDLLAVALYDHVEQIPKYLVKEMEMPTAVVGLPFGQLGFSLPGIPDHQVQNVDFCQCILLKGGSLPPSLSPSLIATTEWAEILKYCPPGQSVKKLIASLSAWPDFTEEWSLRRDLVGQVCFRKKGERFIGLVALRCAFSGSQPMTYQLITGQSPMFVLEYDQTLVVTGYVQCRNQMGRLPLLPSSLYQVWDPTYSPRQPFLTMKVLDLGTGEVQKCEKGSPEFIQALNAWAEEHAETFFEDIKQV